MAFNSEWLSIQNGFHWEWLTIRNHFGMTGGGGGGVGGWGSLGWGGGGVPGVPLGPRDRHLVETTQGRLESLVADRSQTERVSRSAGMRGA